MNNYSYVVYQINHVGISPSYIKFSDHAQDKSEA